MKILKIDPDVPPSVQKIRCCKAGHRKRLAGGVYTGAVDGCFSVMEIGPGDVTRRVDPNDGYISYSFSCPLCHLSLCPEWQFSPEFIRAIEDTAARDVARQR